VPRTCAGAGGRVPGRSGGTLLSLLVLRYPRQHSATYNPWCQAATRPQHLVSPQQRVDTGLGGDGLAHRCNARSRGRLGKRHPLARDRRTMPLTQAPAARRDRRRGEDGSPPSRVSLTVCRGNPG
jgi:hypothetical protein